MTLVAKTNELAGQLARETELAFANTRVVIALSTENPQFDQIELFQRKYLLGQCSDGSEVIFLTTNEDSDCPIITRDIGEHYTALADFGALLDELNTNSPWVHIHEGVHGPPRYVYYDIDFMDDRFKELFREHLESDVAGYSEDYLRQHFDEYDVERVWVWQEGLLPTPTD